MYLLRLLLPASVDERLVDALSSRFLEYGAAEQIYPGVPEGRECCSDDAALDRGYELSARVLGCRVLLSPFRHSPATSARIASGI